MTESAQARGRPQGIYKRRESRLAYHQDNISRYFNYGGPSQSTSPPSSGQSQNQNQNHDNSSPLAKFSAHVHQSLAASPTDPAYLDLLGFHQTAPSNASGLGQQQQVQIQKEQYQNASSFLPYTLTSVFPPASSLPRPDSAPISPLALDPSQAGGRNGYHFVPQPGGVDVFPSDGEDVDMSMPGSRVGSFESMQSFSSMAPSAGTQASSISDGYVWPVTDPLNQPAMAEAIHDLSLSQGYRQMLAPSYSPGQMGSPPLTDADGFSFNNDSPTMNWINAYGPECGTWDPAPVTQQPLLSSGQPWSVERLPANPRANPGCVAFEPDRGPSYAPFKAGEEYLVSGQQFPVMFGPEPVSPMVDDEGEDWEVICSYPNSIVVLDSPKSEELSWSQVDFSPQNTPSPCQVTGHSHMFSAIVPESPSSKPRGRQRALTKQEKQEASDVRKAKACWACHLSKIKCSPCSQETPCQQCARLDGKRRFCHLRCFNDPLETLLKFVLPEYLTGHFTQAKIEKVVENNTTSWGKVEIHIRMDWGHQRPVEATVVALALPNESRFAYKCHTDGSVGKKPVTVRKRSPPLGIPLASFVEMKKDYESMVYTIVTEELQYYVPVPYCGEASGLPERLLRIICRFYTAGLIADQECVLLREALEIHVISTILERNLNLDDESQRKVEEHMNEEYPAPSAPNCAQRQIKLALFMAQRERVVGVLKDWGAMMWSSNKNVDTAQKWAASFSVLVMLILIVDKMVESSYLLYDVRIKDQKRDASAERRRFEELVRLTQTHVFDQAKEIFHSSFKTRKGGKEACNPIRDGMEAFRGRQVPEDISRLVAELQRAHSDFRTVIRSQLRFGAGAEGGDYYGNAGRLASIFLGDFIEPC